jgi:hypothetical protein
MSTAVAAAALIGWQTASKRRARKLRRAAFILSNTPGAAPWLAFTGNLPVDYRGYLIEWLHGSRRSLPAMPESEWLGGLLTLLPAGLVPEVLDIALSALNRGVSPALIEACVQVRRQSSYWFPLNEAAPGSAFPVARVFALLGPNAEWEILQSAWRVSTGPAGARFRWDDARLDRLFSIEIRFVLRAAVAFGGDVSSIVDAILALSQGNSSEWPRSGALYALECAMECLTPATVTRVLRRLAQLDGEETAGLIRLLDNVSAFRPEDREQLVNVPAPFLRKVVKAWSDLGRWERADQGCGYLNGHDALPFRWLMAHPQMFRELCIFFSLNGKVRTRQLLSSVRQLPLFQKPPIIAKSPSGLVALDNLLLAHHRYASRFPEFHAWNLHFSGKKVLKTHSIEHVGARLIENLSIIQMHVIREELLRGFAIATDEHTNVFHQMLYTARRPLARFLRAYARGVDRRIDHPGNQMWLLRHPRVSVPLWRGPIRMTLPVSGIGDVTIGVEEDPHEVLRMGTYVHSCVAAGGGNAHNAVAVLLDINKQVLYARNSKGKFLARQVIAISEEDTIVAHKIYPYDVSNGIKNLFAIYVSDWSLQLGLKIAPGAVRPLTIGQWYDDGTENGE